MKKLPVGIDDFRKIRENDYYYVDKTNLIRDIIDNGSEVTLFTRPRRFGKTLNMSMLKAFFEIGADPAWFEELKISKEKDLCDKHLGKYPVIFMSLKEVSGLNYEEANFGILWRRLLENMNLCCMIISFLLSKGSAWRKCFLGIGAESIFLYH